MNTKESSNFIDYHAFTTCDESKIFKATLAQSENILLGIHCFATGQSQSAHIHIGEDKFFFVLEGNGYFQVGEEFRSAGPGTLVWAPATLPHSVINNNAEPLVVLIGIAPSPSH
jgi:quercetin dioxygenase-like cupin family protein